MEEKKTIDHALSVENGIICYSNMIPDIGVRTYYDENGIIKKEETICGSIIDLISKKKYIKVEKEERKIINIIFCLLTLILIIISKNPIFAIMLIYLYTTNAVKNYIVFYKMIIEYKTKYGTKKSLSRFHAAEHKALNAYDKKNDIPTSAEVKAASRFSKECGTMKFFNKIFRDTTYVLLMFIFQKTIIFVNKKIEITQTTSNLLLRVIVSLVLAMILIVLSEILFDFIENKAILRFMQVFVTTNPTDKEINLAIEAIKNFEELEEKIAQGNDEDLEVVFSLNDLHFCCFKENEEES